MAIIEPFSLQPSPLITIDGREEEKLQTLISKLIQLLMQELSWVSFDFQTEHLFL